MSSGPSLALQPPREILERLAKVSDAQFDVDNTLVVNQGSIPTSLCDILARVGFRCGISTSRCERELGEIFDGTGYHLRGLFSGPVILEDGALGLLPGKDEVALLVDMGGFEAVQELVAHIRSYVSEVPGQDTWKRLGDLVAPLVRVPGDYAASGTIWEQGPENSPDYENVMVWVRKAATELGVLERVSLLEVGNGTLRITIPGTSKGQALANLGERRVVDLSRLAYFGDGRNDIPAAEVVRKGGGLVIAVDDHCSDFTRLADYVTPSKGPAAIEWLLRPLINSQTTPGPSAGVSFDSPGAPGSSWP